MDDQNKNLILATALSFIVILVWFVLFPPPEPETAISNSTQDASTSQQASQIPAAPATDAPLLLQEATSSEAEDAPRVSIETSRISGSVSLRGGRIDDLKLKDYRINVEEGAEIVTMFSPQGTLDAYYALYGWAPAGGMDATLVPGPDSIWSLAGGETLGIETPVTLAWNNGAGQIFNRTIAIDENYMFSITQSVTNNADSSVAMAPYGMVVQHTEPDDLENFFILHEGAVAIADEEYFETDWSDITDAEVNSKWGRKAIVYEDLNAGWIGFTDHFWQAILIPGNDDTFDQALTYDDPTQVYRAVTRLPTKTIEPGKTVSVSTQLFAGAKEWATLKDYQEGGVVKLIDSIDWGWFFFLTKPIFWLLHELNKLIGNMGWAIIGLTLVIKLLLFPLAYKSYVSMAKMKELQPEMEKIKERAGDDRQKLQTQMMELYKKEKVNPAAGCLPILMQIPIFFSLYKVIFVTIELRHAAWLGPFQDLSAPDPTSLLNLFGLLPFGAPEPGSIVALIFIGILPLLLGISMWLQQKLNPAPTDPTQQMIFAWMPWVFMFMLGGFASGLVVYWIANNTITFTQQYTIMRSQGYSPDVFGNIRKSFARKPKDKA
ncbi:MAG: membrane protein insertase YidC [Aliishimia sp.]